MSQFTQTLHDLPASGLIPVVLLVVVGLLLWAAGRRILRAGFIVIGLIVGGTAGWLIGDAMSLGMWSWGAVALGAVSLACVAMLAFRMAVAGAMAAILATAAPLGVITVVEFRARSAGQSMSEMEVTNPVTDEITQWLQNHDNPEARKQAADALRAAAGTAKDGLDRANAALADSLDEQTAAQVEELKNFGGRMVDALRAKWDSTPQTLRPTLIVSAVAGSLLGLIIGGIAPTFSSAAITALGGSLLWLCSLQIIAVRIGVPEGPWLPSSGTVWLAMWLITSAVGVVIQWTFRKRGADKAG